MEDFFAEMLILKKVIQILIGMLKTNYFWNEALFHCMNFAQEGSPVILQLMPAKWGITHIYSSVPCSVSRKMDDTGDGLPGFNYADFKAVFQLCRCQHQTQIILILYSIQSSLFMKKKSQKKTSNQGMWLFTF